MSYQGRQGFWREAFALQGSILPRVLPQVLLFGFLTGIVCLLVRLFESKWGILLGLDVTPHELAGTALGLLLVFRTNLGYDRWYEARKLWGGFVDRSRNFMISALTYGPKNAPWQDEVARWAAAYPWVALNTLRSQRPSQEVVQLIGDAKTAALAAAQHMPSFVAAQLARLLHDACQNMGMDRFAFLQVDRERALLIDNFGGCERILNTPLPRAYSLKLRHFLVLFLLTLPFALLHRFDSDWLVIFLTMLIAYPLLSLDQLGVELENPFSPNNVSHLPLEGIATTIEGNVLGLLKQEQNQSK